MNNEHNKMDSVTTNNFPLRIEVTYAIDNNGSIIPDLLIDIWILGIFHKQFRVTL